MRLCNSFSFTESQSCRFPIVASEVPVEHGASGENLDYDVVEALLRCC